ncbi:Hypothetical protein A7982_12097 [Minicystis rosea]|nr:Hypothetical protein A7982_12097 [Minicystis rosea]
MDFSALHLRLDEIAPLALLDHAGDAEVAAAEAHAAEGCSRCARALVNARETGTELALAAAAIQAPLPALRARVLASARAVSGRAPSAGGRPRRIFDPSGELARLHIGGADDAARTAEVDALALALPGEGDACERLLAQLARSIDFPLLFVSVVRGPRVGYRVQRGLDVAFAEMRDRRRETSFCTHTLSSGGPLVVPNAEAEPFFRGSQMVRQGIKAYVGAPLVTSRGIAVGTVCAMDFRPRSIGREVVSALERFAEPILAEIESERLPPEMRLPRASSAGAPVHRAAWFRGWIASELALARAAGRSSTLLVARGPRAEEIANLAREHEAVGHLSADAVGLLLPFADALEGERRAAEVRANVLPGTVNVMAAAEHASAAAWIEAALAPRG